MQKFQKSPLAWIPASAGLILVLYFSFPPFPLPMAFQATSTPTKSAPSGQKIPRPKATQPASTPTKPAPVVQATPSPTAQPTPTATQISIPTLGGSILRPSATATGQGVIGGSSSEVIIATATGQPTEPPIPVTGSGSSSNCFLGGSLILAFLGAMWTVAKVLPR